MNKSKLKKVALYLLAGLGGLALISVVAGVPLFLMLIRGSANSYGGYRTSGLGGGGGAISAPSKARGLPELISFDEEHSTSNQGGSNIGEGELTERKIVKNGSLSLLVKKAEDTAESIRNISREMDGFVQKSNIYEVEKGVKRGRITIRVPADRFDEAMDRIKDLAVKVEEETENKRDVTERYMDIEARLENRRAEEEQYQEIMERAEDVEDVLKVAEKLGNVRSTIERLESQLDYLSKQVDMSTITVSLTSEAEVEVLGVRWRPLYVIKKSIRGMVEGLTNYIDSAVSFIFMLPVIGLWTASILLALVVFFRILRFVWKRFIRRR